MDIFLKVILYADTKQEMIALLRRLMHRISAEPDDGCGQLRYEWTNIPKDEENE